MEFVKLLLNQKCGNYSYNGASDIKMGNLGLFLTDDVSCSYFSSFEEWAFNNASKYACGNATALKKDNGFILLTDLYDEEAAPIELKMTCEQFVQVLIDWQKKVCKLKPKEVIIKYENDQFVIETKN